MEERWQRCREVQRAKKLPEMSQLESSKDNCEKAISSSVDQSCPTLCDPIDCSMPGIPVHHQLPEFDQTHVHRVSDAIQPSHPLSSPSPPGLQSFPASGSFLRSWFFAADGQSIGVSASALVLLMNIQDRFPLKVKVKLLSRVRLFVTPWTPGSSVHGIF